MQVSSGNSESVLLRVKFESQCKIIFLISSNRNYMYYYSEEPFCTAYV
jgi:hypothetical protein